MYIGSSSPNRLCIFVVLALVLLVWAGVVGVGWCCILGNITPNLSHFPEFDFGSKVGALSGARVVDNAIGVLLKKLGNGRSL
jgi:hypothetical protein